ncbi:MAG TPA: S53 family peptidase [Candidatus Limnocylindrales bacterium]
MKFRTRASVGLVTGILALSALNSGIAAATTGRIRLAGSVPAWAKPANVKGPARLATTVGFRVYLGWRNQASAAALARAVSDPASSQYGHYVTAAQFRQKFAPTLAQITAVQTWLRGRGFTIDYTPANNHYVAAEGTVAQAAAAFGTTFKVYSINGKNLRAPATALTIPASLSGVTAVLGLDESAVFVHTDQIPLAPPVSGFRNARPCSTYWAEKTTATDPNPHGVALPDVYGTDQPYAPCGTTPAQLRGAYGVTGSGLNGSGVTVAVIDAYASPTIVQDVNRYSSDNGLPSLTGLFTQVVAPGTFRRPQNPAQDPQGWSGEETLDVEAVHSMAPGAKIVYVGAPNNYQDLDAALNHVVDRHLAQIVTNSYGFSTELLPPGYLKPYNDTFIQAAAEGIGVYFSSGDAGDETGGIAANAASATPDWPASSPWVTAVGGTSLAVGATNNYLWEAGWETGNAEYKSTGWSTPEPPGTYLYGSGGGTSRLFAQPWYQVGVVPDSMSQAHSSTRARVIPDVSAIGDPTTGMLVGQTQTFPDGTYYDVYRIGGTSLSSPITAGLAALADQKAGHAHGFINPALYHAYGTSAFRDVDSVGDQVGAWRVDYINSVDATAGFRYRFRTFNVGDGTGGISLTIHTGPGYDNVTGVGSPNGSSFFNLP